MSSSARTSRVARTFRQLTSPGDTVFPADLPVPQDDGAADHLLDKKIPSVSLLATSGEQVDLSSLTGTVVLFFYPRTAAPDEKVPDEWNAIPGARGCTPHACGFRDAYRDLKALGVTQVFGLSTQDAAYQREVHGRIHLPYDLLSDEGLELTKALSLPTMQWQGATLIKRMAWIVVDGVIVKVFYPVFPPDKNAEVVQQWLVEHRQSNQRSEE